MVADLTMITVSLLLLVIISLILFLRILLILVPFHDQTDAPCQE